MNGEPFLRCFFGHHKCASRWMLRMLRDVCLETGHRLRHVSRVRSDRDLAAIVREQRVELLCHINARWDDLAGLPALRGFHLIRDPRDLCVSAYYSHRNSHELTPDWPDLDAHRERLRALSTSEGLLLELEFSRPVLEALAQWPRDVPEIEELRYEDLVADPEGSLRRVLAHLDLFAPVDPPPVRRRLRRGLRRACRRFDADTSFLGRHRAGPRALREIVGRYRFSRMSGGREPGTEDPASHFRRGVPGDWMRQFGPEHRARFEELYPGLVERLGYRTAVEPSRRSAEHAERAT